MARLRFMPAARSDLSEIRRHIAKDDPVRAKSFIEEIRGHCRRLAEHPGMHPVATRLDPKARKAVHGAYLIFYDAEDRGILVLRVIHSARDLSAIGLREP